MAVKIQIRRDSAANWTSNNPVLASGEIGFETDTGNIKIGDGSTAWTSLSYTVEGHTRSHAITSTSDHTAGNHKIFYSNGSGAVVELALGADGTVLTAKGATSAPEFAAASGGTPTSIADADKDTKIQCEEGADEDKIRFDAAGVEQMLIDTNGVGINNATPNSSYALTLTGHPHTLLAYTQGDSTTAGALYSYSGNASYAGSLDEGYVHRAGNSAYTFLKYVSTTDNQFILRGDGNAFADGSWSSPAADYAEYFESSDGEAIPYGTTVVLINKKIRPALEGETPIGVIRPKDAAGIVGNNAWNMWKEKYLRNDYGGHILEDYQVCTFTYQDGFKDGKKLEDGTYEQVPNMKVFSDDIEKLPEGLSIPEGTEVITQQRRKLNPDYNPEYEYIPREERAEWNLVGLLGQIPITKGQPVDPRWIKMGDISETIELWLVR